MTGILDQSVSPKPVYRSLYKTSINVGFFYPHFELRFPKNK